ncbi:hypothetical protein BSKO_06824 [Bryopsis sp. KO-2023]|nr:hypothetical protein BSKO_06824 [Bryopsis sp. KO-2023]
MPSNGAAQKRGVEMLRRAKDLQKQKNLKPSDIVRDGSSILAKANSLKSFLKNQKSKESDRNKKMEWFLFCEVLDREWEERNAELFSHLEQISESELLRPQSSGATADVPAEELKAEICGQIRGLHELVGSFRCYGPKGFEEEVTTTKQELNAFKSEIADRLQEGQRSAEEISRELRSCLAAVSKAGVEIDPPSFQMDSHAMQDPWEQSSFDISHLLPEGTSVFDSDALEKASTRFSVELQAIRDGFAAKIDGWKEEYGTSCNDVRAGLLNSDQRSAYIHLKMHFQQRAESGQMRKDVLRNVQSMLPQVTLLCLTQYDDWYTHHRAMLERRQDLVEDWRRQESKLTAAASAEALTIVQDGEKRAERVVEFLRLEAVGEDASIRLGELKVKRSQEVAAMEQEARERRAMELEARRIEEAKEEENRRHNKRLIDKYRDALRVRRAEQAAAEEEARQELEQELALQAEINKERVEYRAAHYESKLEEQEAAEQQRLKDAQRREAQLERLRATVRMKAHRDTHRTTSHTESSVNHVTGEHDFSGPFKPLHGYTTDRLMSDKRFKVTQALISKGLQNHDYAKLAISRAPTLKPQRRDTLPSWGQSSM